ncbi:hypothetical protein ABEB36_013460 [Hypothenemus hampei]|uniref:Uncharacterized protein n=1 Tax=Hypothenemus hampei TaxID=57062 RepID=A0ABD1EAV8_HYPHA
MVQLARIWVNKSRQPSVRVFANAYWTLCKTGSSIPKNNDGLQAVVGNIANEKAVFDAVEDDPKSSTRRIAAQLYLSQSFVVRTLERERLHPYHFQLVQNLNPRDFPLRQTIAE